MVGIRRHIDLIIGSALSVAGMFYFGSIARIEYDGWWHIFIAREDSWRRFFGDIYASAHPPVYYLLLKAASQLGSSPLLYRSPSIIAAGAAIIIMGLTAKRIIRHRGIAILCTLAFGLATSTVIIANEVRQYMTAVLFILVAFYFFLDLVQPSAGTRQVRSRLGFALASSVAVCTHYSAIFFVFAAMATPLLLAIISPGYRLSLKSNLPDRWRADLTTFLPVVALISVAYLLQMRRFSGPMNYMRQFYYSGTEPLVAYMWWALRREFDLFSPVAIGHAGVWAEALGLGLVVVCLVTLFRLFRKEKELPAGAAAPVVFVVLTLSLLAASVAGKYPFGGHMRHQYIIFPFAVLSTFLLLDRVAERLKRRIPQLVLVFVAAALLIANAGQGWKTGDIHREELFTSEFHFFGKEYMPVGAVYVDQFNLIAFFSNVQDWTWHFDRNLIPGKIDLLRMEKEGRHLNVLRDLSRWKARTDDPRLYEDIDVAMTKAGLGAVAVFRLSPEDPGAAPQKTEQDRLSMKISRMAEEHGFVADHVMFHDGYVYVLFSRRHDRGDRLTDVNDSGRITWKECGTRAVCSLGISGRS